MNPPTSSNIATHHLTVCDFLLCFLAYLFVFFIKIEYFFLLRVSLNASALYVSCFRSCLAMFRFTHLNTAQTRPIAERKLIIIWFSFPFYFLYFMCGPPHEGNQFFKKCTFLSSSSMINRPNKRVEPRSGSKARSSQFSCIATCPISFSFDQLMRLFTGFIFKFYLFVSHCSRRSLSQSVSQ